MNEQELYQHLREAVEERAGCRMHTPRDFDFLANRISDSIHTQLSPTTLKRFWGYLDKQNPHTPRLFTLNSLAVYIGYENFDDFQKDISPSKSQSGFILDDFIYTSQLNIGDCIRLTWEPDRIVTIRFMGLDMHIVEESINSKLSKGDTFCCGHFIANRPLCLTRLVHNGSAPSNYVCGSDTGIQFSVLREIGGVLQNIDNQKDIPS